VGKRTDLGQWINIGGEVVEMVALHKLEVRVDVPERYYAQIAPGSQAAVTFEALPTFETAGTVAAIIPRADPQARTFPIKVRIDNPEGRIGVGMLAQVALAAGEARDAVLVPKDAVVRQGPMEIIFRLGQDDTVEPVPVRTAQGVGSWVVIEGPVTPGERIVTRGNERLQPGQPVRAQPLEYALP
jgi:RND family efflux transporter MFP subunit